MLLPLVIGIALLFVNVLPYGVAVSLVVRVVRRHAEGRLHVLHLSRP
jgi:hypothetical protein